MTTSLFHSSEVTVRILLLLSAFNGLSQRVSRELIKHGHSVEVELASSGTTLHAANRFRPDLIVCPYLKERIDASVWQRYRSLIVHPGIIGDRGPSSLDWAITRGLPEWGVTLLQAAEEMDAGDIWGTEVFPLRNASKASTYRREVTAAAAELVLAAIGQRQNPKFKPRPLDYRDPMVTGSWNALMRKEERRIDWLADDTAKVIRKINAADSSPGVRDLVLGREVSLFGAQPAEGLRGEPGSLLAQRQGGVCRATTDGAVWISHMKGVQAPSATAPSPIKLPSVAVLGPEAANLPVLAADPFNPTHGWSEIRYYERDAVGYLHFDFYNGAMRTEQCERLRAALVRVKERPVKVIVLMGGDEFFSNGIDLNAIEAAASPADEAWANIKAINSVVREILTTDQQLTVSAVRSNAAAGGAVLAAAADFVVIRAGTVLNVHYATMGLYGSEYWTYVLPRRLGFETTDHLISACLPTLASEAQEIGYSNRVFAEPWEQYHAQLHELCTELAQAKDWKRRVRRKAEERERDEAQRPLEAYAAAELARMRTIFYDPQSPFQQARRNFVLKLPRQAAAEPLIAVKSVAALQGVG